MMKRFAFFLMAGLSLCACASDPVLPGDEMVESYVSSFNGADNELYTK